MRPEPSLINTYTDEIPGFFSICFGLLLDPRSTLEKLYIQDTPPYLLRIILLLLLLVFGPMAYLLYKYDYMSTRLDTVLIFNIILIITAVIYVFLESVLLYLLGFEIPLIKVLASFCYGLVPIIVLLIACYIVDLSLTGRLSLTTYVITGVPDSDNTVLKNFFYAHFLAKGFFLLILYNSLRVLDTTSFIDALMVTILSCLPFYLAYYVSIWIAENLSPGSISGLQGLLYQTIEAVTELFKKK